MTKRLSVRQVAYFHHLHDERKATAITAEPDQRGEHVFEVEGKARPMLIVGHTPKLDVGSAKDTGRSSGRNDCTIYQVKGRLFYLVLSLQSEVPTFARQQTCDSGDVRKSTATIAPKEFLRQPGLLEHGKVSYIDLRRIYLYPAESVAGSKDQIVGQGTFDQIIREMNLVGLKPRTAWER